MPLYAALTNGRSDRVFRRYLAAERFTLPAASWFDRAAAPYEDAGVPLLSQLFEPMSGAAAMPLTLLAPRLDDGWSPDARAIARRLAAQFRRDGFEALAQAAEDCLHELSARPWRDCMLRHQVESIRRFANVSPLNIRRAIDKGMDSPERLLRRFFRFHLLGIRTAPWIDRPALPLQRMGVPILENDLPPIPPWPRAL